MEKYKALTRRVVAECDEQLANDFSLPAIEILTRHAARLGLHREDFEAIRQQPVSAYSMADNPSMAHNGDWQPLPEIR
jgi:hypothetical protein